jgi:hypothetical protein
MLSARAHDENSWPGSKAAHEQPLAVKGENSRAKVQNVRGDSSGKLLSLEKMLVDERGFEPPVSSLRTVGEIS